MMESSAGKIGNSRVFLVCGSSLFFAQVREKFGGMCPLGGFCNVATTGLLWVALYDGFRSCCVPGAVLKSSIRVQKHKISRSSEAVHQVVS